MNLNESAYEKIWRADSDRRGALIVFCGPDGAGKTTQIRLLVERLRKEQRAVITTRQPTDWYRNNPTFQNYAATGTKTDHLFLALLAAADRRLHITEVVDPQLQAGHWVVSDRYVYSSLVYFAERGIDPNIVAQFNFDIPRPDLSVFLDVPADILETRIEKRDGSAKKYEERDRDRLERLRSNFQTIAQMDSSIVQVDGRMEDTEIHSVVLHRLRARGLLT